jgi:hypothetical protein
MDRKARSTSRFMLARDEYEEKKTAILSGGSS